MGRRVIVEALSAALSNGYLSGWMTGRLYQGPLKTLCVPGLSCYSCPGAFFACPLGAWQSALSGAVPKFPVYVLGLLLLFAACFGRFICGWLCPFGFFQDLIHRLPFPKMKNRPWMASLSRLRLLFFVLALRRGHVLPAVAVWVVFIWFHDFHS